LKKQLSFQQKILFCKQNVADGGVEITHDFEIVEAE
jgi:hypothetical protein